MERIYEKNSGNAEKLTEDTKKKRFDDLKKLLEADDDLKCWRIEDDYIKRYLSSTCFDVEAAMIKLKQLYELLRDHPDWCGTPSPIGTKRVINEGIRVMIPPYTDKEGRPIYIARCGKCDPSKMDLLEQIDTDDIWIENLVLNDPTASEKGLCVIIDIADYNWRMLKWCTPENVKLSVKKLHTLPFKDYRIHVVNSSIWIKAAINIMWPLIPAYIKKMVKFHFNNWDSLHQHIDKELLPTEYHGFTQMDYDDYNRKLFENNDKIVASFQKYRIIKK